MKTDKNKPLSDHTKLNYYECYAKLVLEELFPDRYPHLRIDDKPDLQGDNVGIEVTIANDPKHQEALANWVKANNCQDDTLRDHYIERMAQLGVKYTGGVQGWPGFIASIGFTKDAVESKIKKLKNGNYKSFERYELFIFTDTWYFDDDVKTAKEYLFCDSVSEYYKTVFVLSQGVNLHIFENGKGIYYSIPIDNSEQFDRSIRARKIVEDAEELLR